MTSIQNPKNVPPILHGKKLIKPKPGVIESGEVKISKKMDGMLEEAQQSFEQSMNSHLPPPQSTMRSSSVGPNPINIGSSVYSVQSDILPKVRNNQKQD